MIAASSLVKKFGDFAAVDGLNLQTNSFYNASSILRSGINQIKATNT